MNHAENIVDMVDLVGNSGHIAFASSIRAVWLDRVTQSLSSYPGDKREEALAVMVRAMNSIPDASWWVENQHNLREAFGPAWRAEMEK